MPVDKSDVIDLIGIDKQTDKCVLTISDHLNWSEVNEHLLALQSKINSYLEFIESGQISHEYPNSVGKRIEIKVVCKFEIPNKVFEEYEPRIMTELKKADVDFVWEKIKN